MDPGVDYIVNDSLLLNLTVFSSRSSLLILDMNVLVMLAPAMSLKFLDPIEVLVTISARESLVSSVPSVVLLSIAKTVK